jgi:hypothetical protein
MNIFAKLGSQRAFERLHLPFLRSIEDFDIVRTVGFHQEAGTDILLKQIYLEGICSITTMTRRLGKV